jgi:hypothetical protein
MFKSLEQMYWVSRFGICSCQGSGSLKFSDPQRQAQGTWQPRARFVVNSTGLRSAVDPMKHHRNQNWRLMRPSRVPPHFIGGRCWGWPTPHTELWGTEMLGYQTSNRGRGRAWVGTTEHQGWGDPDADLPHLAGVRPRKDGMSVMQKLAVQEEKCI